MIFHFLATLATFKKEDNRASRAYNNQDSDMLEAIANKIFLIKKYESKSDLETNSYIDFESENNNNNNNSTATSLQDSQKYENQSISTSLPIVILFGLEKN